MVTVKECDLCGLGCGKYPLEQRVGGTDRYFCCLGCMNVYVILWESGAVQPGQDIRTTELFQRSLKLGLISNREREGEPQGSLAEDPSCNEVLLHVTGMWCTSCAWLIEHALSSLPGIVQAEASFASDLVKVRYRPQSLPPERISQRIGDLGYKAEPYSTDSDASRAERRDLLIRTGLAAFLWANVMSFSLVLYAGYFEQISGSLRRGLPFVLMVLATPVVFYCAQPVLRLAWRGLLHRTIRMEALLALGILAAYGYSVIQAFRGDIHLYFDTATVIVTLVLTGKLIERDAKEKVSQWIAALHRMMPNKARVLAKGGERFVSVNALEPGQIFVVKAGEHIPADGVVIDGESHADESLLTGESTPAGKRRGSPVVAGGINVDGVLHVRATRLAQDSTLSRIIVRVERALGSRCELERTVDRVSRIFVPCVVLISILTFLFDWRISSGAIGHSLMRGISVLVIACPCALGLATPLTITAAFGAASRRGVILRDGRVLETLREIDTVILDKTGTVTEGTFSLLELVSVGARDPEVILAGPTLPAHVASSGALPCSLALTDDTSVSTQHCTDSLTLLAALEQYSEHPLGRAVLKSARERGVTVPEASSIQIHKGSGITGMVKGQLVFAGNRRLLTELGIALDYNIERKAREWEESGRTVIFVGWDRELRALAVFGDRIKPEAIAVASELKRRGVVVRLVSGDSQATTRWTASEIGIELFESEILPENKAEVVRRLQEGGAAVAMVGDGINDAPALAQADLGIALGSGSDIAMKAAAVVLMNPSLLKILDVFDLSQRTMRVVRQNLFWAFFYNSAGISLAVAGILNPIMAAAAMLLSSLSVVGNSLRLVRSMN